jgi:hypothetical protein
MDSELPKNTKQRGSGSKREDPNYEPRIKDISNNDAFDVLDLIGLIFEFLGRFRKQTKSSRP